jgi:hypothetical protein
VVTHKRRRGGAAVQQTAIDCTFPLQTRGFGGAGSRGGAAARQHPNPPALHRGIEPHPHLESMGVGPLSCACVRFESRGRDTREAGSRNLS